MSARRRLKLIETNDPPFAVDRIEALGKALKKCGHLFFAAARIAVQDGVHTLLTVELLIILQSLPLVTIWVTTGGSIALRVGLAAEVVGK